VREGAVRVSGRLKIAQPFKAGFTTYRENKSPLQRATDLECGHLLWMTFIA
jgi:hypothetical protein